MYEVIDGHTVMSVNDWLRCGLTMDQFWKDSKRGMLDIYRRSTGGNTLIDVLSIRRPERRRKIELEMGKLPKDGLSKVPSIFTVVADTDAIAYYTQYTDERGFRLSDDTQHLYANGAAVLNTLIAARRQMIESNLKIGKKINMAKMYESFSRFAEEQTEFRNALPRNARRLREKMEEYGNGGGRDYGCLVKRNAVSGGTSGAAKISEKAGQWLVARFATPINKVTMEQLYEEYNAIVPLHQDSDDKWEPIKTVDTIRNFLNRPEIKPLWYGMRYGELKSKEKYARQHRTLLPEVRDALWYGDGTKLNFYYLNDKGEISTTCVYEVIDVSSEAFIGYCFSDHEDYEAQYYAYRMAIQESGCRPYEIRFDNQGGHKKLESINFLKKITPHAIPTAPYNGPSKTIESIFGRFQQSFMHKGWYFTGQNVTAKKQESHPNMEFILANKANIPTLDEAKRIYLMYREAWNNAPHPKTGRPRIEMYRTSENPKAQKLNSLDLLGIFGVMTQKPSKYRANGIEIQVKGQKYAFEVLDAHQLPDMEFIRNNTDREFYVEYIPDDMSFCGLYTKNTKGEFVLVTAASKFIEVHRALQDQDELDTAFIRHVEHANKQMRLDLREEIEKILEIEGMHPAQHGLVMPKLKGNFSNVKNEDRPRQKVLAGSIGKVLKEESMETEFDYMKEY